MSCRLRPGREPGRGPVTTDTPTRAARAGSAVATPAESTYQAWNPPAGARGPARRSTAAPSRRASQGGPAGLPHLQDVGAEGPHGGARHHPRHRAGQAHHRPPRRHAGNLGARALQSRHRLRRPPPGSQDQDAVPHARRPAPLHDGKAHPLAGVVGAACEPRAQRHADAHRARACHHGVATVQVRLPERRGEDGQRHPCGLVASHDVVLGGVELTLGDHRLLEREDHQHPQGENHHELGKAESPRGRPGRAHRARYTYAMSAKVRPASGRAATTNSTRR